MNVGSARTLLYLWPILLVLLAALMPVVRGVKHLYDFFSGIEKGKFIQSMENIIKDYRGRNEQRTRE